MTELSRPSLAVLNEDYPKIKNVISENEIEDLLNFIITIVNIKISTAEEGEAMDIQSGMILDLIKTKFGYLTIPEIKEAFKMYVSKSFPGIKVFRILDCVSVGEILQAFTEYRSDTLRDYSQKKQVLLHESQKKELSTEEKEKIVLNGVERAFYEYIESKEISEPSEYIFDFLVEKKKIINNSNPAIIKYYQQKIDQATTQLEQEALNKTATNKTESRQLKEDLEAIMQGHSPKIIIRAKRIILKEYFEKQISLKQKNIF